MLYDWLDRLNCGYQQEAIVYNLDIHVIVHRNGDETMIQLTRLGDKLAIAEQGIDLAA